MFQYSPEQGPSVLGGSRTTTDPPETSGGRADAPDSDTAGLSQFRSEASSDVSDLDRVPNRELSRTEHGSVDRADLLVDAVPEPFDLDAKVWTRASVLALFVVLVSAALAGVFFAALPGLEREPAAAPATAAGTATVDSSPSGAVVVVDGQTRGTTPLRLSLPVGEHDLEVRHEGTARTIVLQIEAGTISAQHVEFAAPAVPVSGRMEVTSDPSGVPVTVDGSVRGTTPLTLEEIEPGDHQISLARGATVVRRTVTVEAGATATVMASLVGAANAAGWVVLRAPIELQVFDEGGLLLGTTTADRLMLPAGRHQLDVASVEYEFRTTVTIPVVPGQTATQYVSLPNGSLSVNALPWAEVFVDGSHAGTTPLANLSLPVGRHEVTWRHPDHGERRELVTVRAVTATRVGVDFTQ